MAKVRVYELARELSIENKKLVEKLNACGIVVKNHMSTLDEEAVEKARQIVSGAVSEVIEETRIKPRIIRRRKKTIRPEAEIAVETAKKEEAETLEGEPVIKEGEEQEPVGKGVDLVAQAPLSQEVEKEVSPVEEKPQAEGAAAKAFDKVTKTKEKVRPKTRARKSRKKGVDKPARIIKRPEEGPLQQEILAKHVEEKIVTPIIQAQEQPFPKPVPSEAVGIAGKEGKAEKAKPSKKKKALNKATYRHRKKEIYERADLYAGRSLKRKDKKAGKKGKEVSRKQRQTEITVPKPIKRRIKIQEYITVAELAKGMAIKASDVIKRLITLGAVANINQSIDFETASVVADDFGYELELGSFQEALFISEVEDKTEDLGPRPPVVTIMGHVDHGKTSLLDYIRKSNIIGAESGGITQHIGAYYVKTDGGDIVFLDTPGHEAFTAMRARGAKVTDIIILVVAADDGVMPQTREAINHARAASIPIVVAINKIDKAEAKPDKVVRELAELDLVPEDWGGETIFGNISAKTGEGVQDLLGLILLQAEILELKGNPNKEARGTIIEAKLDKSKGAVATVLIKNGTLHKGDHFVCGEHYGRVRAMLDHRGRRMKSAGPSVPVEIYGISGVPMAGDEFIVVGDEKTSKQVIEHRKAKARRHEVAKRGFESLDELFERIREGGVKELNIVLKGDVQGSIEALTDSLTQQKSEEVKVNVIHSGTGAITESDVMLASASGAIIIGFNVRANPRVSEVAERENVDIRYYDVIYNVVKDIRLAMVGLLEPIYKEHVIGRADIKEVFRIPKIGAVAGCQVTDGHIERNAKIRLLRDDVVVFDGRIASLRRFKEDVKEVQTGYECGIGVENFQDIKPGDVFEVYQMEEEEAHL